MIEPTLAKEWKDSLHVGDYLVSEKLDGVRALWDGNILWTRQGKQIHAPQWFINSIPHRVQLDGELYIGRGKIEETSGLVNKAIHNNIDNEGWRKVKYIVFDSPSAPGNFYDRIEAIKRDVERWGWHHKFTELHQFTKFSNHRELRRYMDGIVQNGGEGIMMREIDAAYECGRSNTLFKLKPKYDAEAKVIGHHPGKGRNSGRLGSLICVTEDGKKFRCSGMDDFVRDNPPAVGSIITYEYGDLSKNGIPKFPRYLRVCLAK